MQVCLLQELKSNLNVTFFKLLMVVFFIEFCCRHEGRTWSTEHRGRLWIAAAAKQPSDDEILACERMYRNYYGGKFMIFVVVFEKSLILDVLHNLLNNSAANFIKFFWFFSKLNENNKIKWNKNETVE